MRRFRLWYALLRGSHDALARCPLGPPVCTPGGTKAQCQAPPPVHSTVVGGSLALTAAGCARPGSLLGRHLHSGLAVGVTTEHCQLGRQLPRGRARSASGDTSHRTRSRQCPLSAPGPPPSLRPPLPPRPPPSLSPSSCSASAVNQPYSHPQQLPGLPFPNAFDDHAHIRHKLPTTTTDTKETAFKIFSKRLFLFLVLSFKAASAQY